MIEKVAVGKHVNIESLSVVPFLENQSSILSVIILFLTFISFRPL